MCKRLIVSLILVLPAVYEEFTLRAGKLICKLMQVLVGTCSHVTPKSQKHNVVLKKSTLSGWMCKVELD